MGRDKRNETRSEQFTKWVYAHRLLPAWQALSFPARDAYFHLQVRCYAETVDRKGKGVNNNGAVFRSPRALADDMGCSVKTASAALADLQAKGWIVCTNPWERGTDGSGKTATFQLTMLSTGQGKSLRPATEEPKRWCEGSDYPIPVYGSYAPKPRKGRAKNITHPPIRAQSGGKVRPIRAQSKPSGSQSAPYSGAVKRRIAPLSAPYSDAYLVSHIQVTEGGDESDDRELARCLLGVPRPIIVPLASEIDAHAAHPPLFGDMPDDRRCAAR